jgi:hypothetical protein
MEAKSAENLLAVLSGHSPEWTRWLKYAELKWTNSAVPPGNVIAQELFSFLGLPRRCRPELLLETIQKHFQIRRSSAIAAPPGEGLGRIAKDNTELPLSNRNFLIDAGKAAAPRSHFVLAHEIAHFLFAGFASRLHGSDRPVACFDRTKVAERFCWSFALELFCSNAERRGWTREYVSTLMRAKEATSVDIMLKAGAPFLSYWHVKAIARRYGISIRATILALDRMPILDEVGCGAAILRHVPNQWTGREAGHRVWQYARPSWGHVLFNQRVSKQGFVQAARVYDRGENHVSELHTEHLLLKWRRAKASGWELRRFETPVVYTPIDVENEGRYIMAIWKWQ